MNTRRSVARICVQSAPLSTSSPNGRKTYTDKKSRTSLIHISEREIEAGAGQVVPVLTRTNLAAESALQTYQIVRSV